MRTTLTIEPSVAARINRLVKKEGRTMKSVVNDVLRAGLKSLENAAKAEQKPFVVEPFNLGPLLPPYDVYENKLGQLADVLEDEEIIARMHRDSSRR
jgi:hypothetical protein